MKAARVLAMLVVLCLPSGAWGGERHYWMGEASLPFPLSGRPSDVEVTAARVVVTLLPIPELAPDMATVRVEYDLKGREKEGPVVVVGVGLPIACAGLGEKGYPVGFRGRPAIYVKLDGHPVETRFLSLYDLAEETIQDWSRQIDLLLEKYPSLNDKVKSIREQAEQEHDSWPAMKGVRELADWMREHMEVDWPMGGPAPIAAGLLRVRPHWWGRDILRALVWLDPTRDASDWSQGRRNLYKKLSDEWRHKELLLDPFTGQLVDVGGGFLVGSGMFGVFVFDIGVEPLKEHKLVVQHRQRLGGRRRIAHNPFNALRYNLTSGNRWPGARASVIEVRVPVGWTNVAIRPRGSYLGDRDGFAVYRIQMKRPGEELYVSAVPPR